MVSTLLFVLLSFVALIGHAQAPAMGGPTPAAPTAVPLDGGAILLMTRGIVYYMRHLWQRRPPWR
jgi:hypothetical protein